MAGGFYYIWRSINWLNWITKSLLVCKLVLDEFKSFVEMNCWLPFGLPYQDGQKSTKYSLTFISTQFNAKISRNHKNIVNKTIVRNPSRFTCSCRSSFGQQKTKRSQENMFSASRSLALAVFVCLFMISRALTKLSTEWNLCSGWGAFCVRKKKTQIYERFSMNEIASQYFNNFRSHEFSLRNCQLVFS